VSTETPTHAGGVVVRRSETQLRFLLVSARWQPDQLVLPKGHVEPGETVEEAARREVLEEAGVTATITIPLGLVEYRSPRGRVRAQFYLMEFVEEAESSEGRRREWLALDQALAALPFADTRQLILDADRALRG
jgi:8-oxo-dGTP pyrophosphatase MutT (NUDIX family)